MRLCDKDPFIIVITRASGEKPTLKLAKITIILHPISGILQKLIRFYVFYCIIHCRLKSYATGAILLQFKRQLPPVKGAGIDHILLTFYQDEISCLLNEKII